MNKNKLFVFTATIILSFLYFTSSFAQFTPKNKPEDITELKKRTLLVGLLEENIKFVEKHSSKEQESILSDYRKEIKEYNDNLKAAVGRFWRFNEKIEYKSIKEIDDLRKAKELSKYAILEHDVVIIYKSKYAYQLKALKTRMKEPYTLRIELGKGRSKKKIISTIMPNIIASREDFAYALLYIQHYLESYKNEEVQQEIKTNNKKLANLTLFMDRRLLSRETTEAKIKSVYPYKFKIVSREYINEAIWNRKEGICYIQIIPLIVDSTSGLGSILFSQQIVLASTGEILAHSYPNGLLISTRSRQQIEIKTLEELLKISEETVED